MANYLVELYTPHDGQRVFHDCTARFIVMNCGRRFGKTIAAANECCRFACEYDNTLTWWVAPTYKQARIAYRQIKKALAPISTRKSDVELRIELVNGAVIECRSADNPDNLRGEGVHMLVVEEAAMMPGKLWHEILRPMLADTNGRAVFISTPKGRNWFYMMYMRGLDSSYPDYASFTFPTSANPHVPPSEIEAARRDMPEDLFRQEILAEFLEESAGVFRKIGACTFDVDYDASGEWQDPHGLIQGHMYFAGWDVAKYMDFSVMTVIDAMTRRVVHWFRTNKIDYHEQIKDVVRIARIYDAYILMDCTGVGDAVLEALKLQEPGSQGYLFTNTSKKPLVEGLQLAFQHQNIQIPNIPVLISELQQFEYQFSPSTRVITYGAPENEHDDCVFSLALAVHAATKQSIPLAGEKVTQAKSEQPDVMKIDPFSYAMEHGLMGAE